MPTTNVSIKNHLPFDLLVLMLFSKSLSRQGTFVPYGRGTWAARSARRIFVAVDDDGLAANPVCFGRAEEGDGCGDVGDGATHGTSSRRRASLRFAKGSGWPFHDVGTSEVVIFARDQTPKQSFP